MNLTASRKDAIYFFTLVLFTSSYIVDLPAGIGIAYIILLLASLVICYVAYDFYHKISIKLSGLEIFFSLFVLFCMMSCKWAVNPSYSISRCKGMVESLIIVFVLYTVHYRDDNADSLLKAIMIGYYIVVGYVLIKYGVVNTVSLITNGERIPNFILNSNVLGACSAYSLLLTAHYIFKRERHFWYVFSIVPIAGLVVSGSRKAIIIIVIGVMVYFSLIQLGAKRGAAIVNVIASVIALGVLIYLLSKLSVFSGVNDRIVQMINGLVGHGGTDSSTITRMRLKQVGFELVSKNWLKGVGIDNPGLFGGAAFQREYYYLHDNFLELLAGVGVIGFVLYYMPYIIVLIRYIKYRNFKDREYNICVTLLIVWLIMDYGIVTYSYIGTYFFLLAFWIESEKLKRIHCNDALTRGKI